MPKPKLELSVTGGEDAPGHVKQGAIESEGGLDMVGDAICFSPVRVNGKEVEGDRVGAEREGDQGGKSKVVLRLHSAVKESREGGGEEEKGDGDGWEMDEVESINSNDEEEEDGEGVEGEGVKGDGGRRSQHEGGGGGEGEGEGEGGGGGGSSSISSKTPMAAATNTTGGGEAGDR